MAFDLKDYVEVADRIRAWYAQYPLGAIHTSIVEHTDQRVTVRAEVYRDVHADPGAIAGVGHSFLTIPGTTPYTKGAELENAETSAVGRALVMAGIPSKAVASHDEVRTKKSGGPTDTVNLTIVGQAAQDAAPSAGTGQSAPPLGTNPVPETSEPEDPTAPTVFGEGTDRDEGSSGSGHLTKEEQKAFAKALGGQTVALGEARKKFGERIRSLSDLTRDMALEMVAERVG